MKKTRRLYLKVSVVTSILTVVLIIFMLFAMFMGIAAAMGVTPEDIMSNNHLFDVPDTVFFGSEEVPPDVLNLNLASSGGFLWPLIKHGTITSPYGRRIHPIYHDVRFHRGIDISAKLGQDIRAVKDGKVIHAAYFGAYGLLVIIDHTDAGFPDLRSYYGHLSKIEVKTGIKISTGQVLGKAGSTGVSTGSHLHFEVRYKGAAFNPIVLYN